MEPAATSEVTKLAGLKHGIYHPRLPTLRKMSMDTITHKLPTEHARTTTDCPSVEFGQAATTLRKSYGKLHSGGVINKSLNGQMSSYKPLGHIDAWQKIVERLNARESSQQNIQGLGDHKIVGYVGRYRHPAVTSSWQHALKNMRPHSAKPMPTAMYTRYRSINTRPQSARPWKT